MKEPKWLDRRLVMAIHDEAVEMFGGTPGLRDDGPLQSALDRPRNLHAYRDDATIFDLAAALCHGICKNHAFLDGNKRTALLAARAFLFLNGLAFEPREVDEVETMVAVASGAADETRLAEWFRAFSTPTKVPRNRKR